MKSLIPKPSVVLTAAFLFVASVLNINVYASGILLSSSNGKGISNKISKTVLGVNRLKVYNKTHAVTPVISSFTPTSGTTGTTVTISGKNFTGATNVYFGAIEAKSFSVVSDNTITAVVDSGASGNISVVTSNGLGSLTGFTYLNNVGRNILVIAADNTAARYIDVESKLISTGLFSSVSVFDANATTPTLDTLIKYGAVLVYSINGYANSATMGNVLASYISAGGGVVSATYNFGQYTPIGGAFANNYQVFTPGTNMSGSVTLGSILLPSHSTVAGISNFNGGSSAPRENISTLTSGSYTVANWSDGLPLIGVKDNVGPASAKRVDLNFFPPSSDVYASGWNASTQGALLMSNALLYVYNNPSFKQPNITSFSPSKASSSDTVTIYGKDLSGIASVTFGGVSSPYFTVLNDSTIAAVVGRAVSGNVIVSSPGGSDTLTGFTYVKQAPKITSFTPTSSGNGNYVTISGNGFTGTTAVSFGGVPSNSFYASSDTLLYAYVGAGASGFVSVSTPDGTDSLSGFTYLASPIVTSFSPASAAKGTTVTIKGSGFSKATYVYFGTTSATFSIINDSTINAVVGTGQTGSVYVYSAVGFGSLGGFTYLAPIPVITSFSPTTASTGGYVYIYGSGFSGATSVSFGGVAATTFYAYSDTYMYAYVGSGASGSVSVTSSGGTGTLVGFTYVAPPVVKSFSPASAAKGTTVTIKGSGFINATRVAFGGTYASSYSIVNDSTITAIVNTGATGSVQVYNSYGSGLLSGFTYIAPVPVITSFSPVKGGTGTYVTIYGTGLSGATSVTFGGISASSFYSSGDTYLYAYVGSGASGSVSVTTSGGTAKLAGFTYVAPPVVKSFSPTSAATGKTITITGSGFLNTTSVSFGSTYASSYSIVNDSTITAIVGTGTTGSVQVSSSYGSGSLGGFTYIAPVPVITSFTPTSGGSGTYVTVYGTGLSGATSVTFGGVPASSFYVYGDTYLYAYVGSGASGSVSVTTSGGTAKLAGFTYYAGPKITSFSPSSATKGATVTIHGSGFTNAYSVYFGGTNATSYTVLNDSTITAIVSTGASGSVEVDGSYGYGYLGGFTYIAPVPVITSFSPTSSGSGKGVYIYGTGLTGTTSVSFGGVPASSFYVYSDTYIYAYVGSGASGSVSITTSGGTATLAGFTYLPPPVITSFSPVSATKGATVTISGKGFTNATSVYFGGMNASNYNVINDSTITAVVSTGSTGSISIYTAAGTGTLGGFTYIAPVPVITSFSPTSAGTGRTVSIYGTGLTGATSVTFGGIPATNFYVNSDTYIYAYVGSGASGSVSVTTSGGTATLAGFTYLAPPVITSFSPASATKGATVIILGKNFTNATYIYFGGTYAASYSVVNDSTITAVVGAGTTGSISVYTSAGSGTLGGFTYIAPVPVVTSFSPTSAGKGGYVYIYGTGFTGTTSVTFGGIPASTFYSGSDTYLTAYVGTGASGSVSVTTSGGTGTLGGFTYIAPATVTSFTPTTASKGTVVTISGSGFLYANSVSFGGTSATNFTIVDDSTLTAIVGAGTSGNVSVTTSGGTGSLSGFTYVAPVPVITSISPTSAGKGGSVYIYGSGFTGATSVLFGGVPATSFYVYSDTYMYAYVGSGASGSVSVTTSGGTGNLAGFIYLAPPTVTSFSPATATQGDTVTIVGSGFTNAYYVYFGGTNAASFKVINDNTIKAVVGGGKSGNVSVNTSVGTGSLAGFTYVAPVPTITSISPTSSTKGNTVYIYGTGLTGATSVTFGGVPASSFYVYNDTYMYAYVGNGATGSVVVTTPGGKATFKGFIYATAPNITSFYPTTATRGDTVTIYGTSFSGTTSVYFGGTNPSSYTVVDDKTIKAVVGGGYTGSITVYNPAGSSVIAGFIYTTPPPLVSSFSPTSAVSGSYVYISGAGFTGATAVTFGGVPATSFYVYSDTYMYAYVGNGASGSVSVTTAYGTGSLAGFVYAVIPTITSFSPATATRGDSVIIHGKGLSGATYVYFGGTNATSYNVLNDSTISAVVGSGASGSISVYNAAGIAFKVGFTYKVPAPLVTSFSPTSAAKGNYVYVYGTGFLNATKVTFGGVAATSFYVYNDTYLYAYVGSGASGSVSVTTAAGTGSLPGFIYLSAPSITSFSPKAASKGDTVTIVGKGFTNATYVYFGGTYAGSYTVLNDSTIQAVVGSGTSGSVSVYNSIGSAALAGFTYKAPVPTITSFSPTAATKGTFVSVYGTGFVGATAVSFGGVPAASFYVSNDTYLYAYVGNGASGSVSVTTSGGTASLAGFTYTGAPIITAFTPKAGVNGSAVTITGHAFSNATSVFFGGDSALTYTVVNDSTIKAVVGIGASGSVGVTTNYGTGTLAGFSYCKPSLDTISITACGSYIWHKVTYTKSGNYNFDTLSAGGCDSLTTLVLKINKPTADTINKTVCGSYTWHGTTYTKSGRYTFDSLNAAGCDSLTTLVLKVGYAVTDTITLSIPNSYTWHGTTYTKSGTYTFDTLGVLGCDSLTVLNLTIYNPNTPSITSFTPTSTCPNTSATIFITGSNFTGVTSVTLGGIAVDSFRVNSTTSITAYVSAGITGNIAVLSSNGTGTSATSFTNSTGGFNEYSYTANNDNTISVIDNSTNKTVSTIRLSDHATGMCLSPDGKMLYVTIYGKGGTLYAINTTTNTLVNSTSLNSFLTGICISKGGSKLYVLDGPYGSIHVVNTKNLSLVKDLAFGGGDPPGICISADGLHVYVANQGTEDVSAINTLTDSAVNIKVGLSPTFICGSPDSKKVYVANVRDNSISVINAVTNTVSATISTGNTPYDIRTNKDGSKLYVANSVDNNISVIDTKTNNLIIKISVGVTPSRLILNLDSSKLYVLNAGSPSSSQDTISVINTTTDIVESTILTSNKIYDYLFANVPTSCTLPVDIANISASVKNSSIAVNWFTATELNTSHFIVQHSTNGNTFTDLGSVKAIGIGANKYEYTDLAPVVGTNYYRLKSVDKDGAVTYSKVVSVQLSINNYQLSIYPNPVKNIFTIGGSHIARVEVIDNLGRVVHTQNLHDATNPQLSIGTLSAGLYHLRIQTTDGKVSGLGFVKE